MNIKEKLIYELEPSNIEGLSIEIKDFFPVKVLSMTFS